MFGDVLAPTHLLLILIVALVVLGPKRLPEVGRSLGKGIRDFKDAVSSYTPDGLLGDDHTAPHPHTHAASPPAEAAAATGAPPPAEATPDDASPAPAAPQASAEPAEPHGEPAEPAEAHAAPAAPEGEVPAEEATEVLPPASAAAAPAARAPDDADVVEKHAG